MSFNVARHHIKDSKDLINYGFNDQPNERKNKPVFENVIKARGSGAPSPPPPPDFFLKLSLQMVHSESI